ncbi:lactonase family protein [Candidatus Tokpelaia sp.]|uniref:lactonase family protein n=1 Tax=Candidatus Tokpelaia sp. TaxID=2233777 RepID=UPI00123927A4|nr:lactonase family protein [Candidatus Tokpelaia sp.]KAA6405128.1 lactonase family protein [Candidatus Tokpelaia sp.]
MSQRFSRRSFALGAAALGVAALGSTALGSLAFSRPAFAAGRSIGAAQARVFCFIGGYTRHGPPGGAGNGQGISVFEMNRDTGQLNLLTVFVDIASPSFITLSKDCRFLYAVSELDDYNNEGDGCVTAFAVDKRTGSLTKLNTVSSGGSVPAHLSVHPSGQYVLTANYTGGSVAVFPIKADGSLAEATNIVHNGGPRQPARAADNPEGNFAVSDHSGSHPHMVAASPDGRFVLVNDAGLDRVYVWSLDLAKGRLMPAKIPYYEMEPGSAPRHFAFSANGQILYNLCEQNSRIIVSNFNPTTGEMAKIQEISTLSPDFRGSNLAAEILVSSDGRYVYASNRLADTVTVFAVAADGTLTWQEEVWAHADYGRAIMFDPGGEFLFWAGQRSDAVTSFRVNRETGGLSFTGRFVPVGSPTTFAFMVAED